MALEDPSANPSFPDYPQMIMGAIEELNEKEGSSKDAITNYIESNYADLPPSNPTHVSHTLDKLKQTGHLLMMKDDTYLMMKQQQVQPPDPTNGPVKRGRGRPPKPKIPGAANQPQLPSRPRGRPPSKPRDLLAPITRPSKPPSTGRPRGRPRKNPVGDAVSGGGAGDGVKRGRGRPRKN